MIEDLTKSIPEDVIPVVNSLYISESKSFSNKIIFIHILFLGEAFLVVHWKRGKPLVHRNARFIFKIK